MVVNKPHLNLTTGQTVVVLNAEAYEAFDSASRKSVKFVKESTFDNIRNESEKNRRKKEAYAILKKWTSTPGYRIAYGTAKFLLSNERNAQVATELGVIDRVKQVVSEHQENCPTNCKVQDHSGGISSECSHVVRIYSSSVCNLNNSPVVGSSAASKEQSPTVGMEPSNSSSANTSDPRPANDHVVNIFRSATVYMCVNVLMIVTDMSTCLYIVSYLIKKIIIYTVFALAYYYSNPMANIIYNN